MAGARGRDPRLCHDRSWSDCRGLGVLDFIISELGLGRSTVSATYTVGTLVGSFSLPFIGRVIDRFGPRRFLDMSGSYRPVLMIAALAPAAIAVVAPSIRLVTPHGVR